MNFADLAFIFSIVFLNFRSCVQDDTNKYLTPKNCSKVFSTTVPKYVAYDEPYRTRNWLGVYKWKVRTNYKVVNQVVYHTTSICCNGYSAHGLDLCAPVCNPECGNNEICTKPEICECTSGYERDSLTKECRPVCSKGCINGECVSPEVCACNNGYHPLHISDDVCIPTCNNCTSLEYCLEPHVCKCLGDYTRASIERLDTAEVTECRPVCDRECFNADCIEPNVCRCHPGYENFDNDAFTCEPKCSLGCRDGNCTAPETCTCFEGYALKSASYVCEPVCKNECGHGVCVAPDICSCNDGYVNTGDNGPCQPYCSSDCPNGRCTSPEACTCDPGYKPVDNRTSCEPICTEACVMGNCTAPETCTCHDGYKLAVDSNHTCEPVCSNECVNGVCTAPDTCACNQGYEMRDDKCGVVCRCDKGYCNDTSSDCAKCFDGYELVFGENSTACRPHCDSGCKNGQCMEPQLCECDEYYRSDNDSGGNSICVHACGGDCNRGTCVVDNGTCSCGFGWTGTHCDKPEYCMVGIGENTTVYGQINEYENLTFLEEPWTGPVCHNSCLKEVTNTSKCYYHSQAVIACFIDINTACNVQVEKAGMFKKNTDLFTGAVYSASLLLLAVIASLLVFFVWRRRKSVRSLEMMKTIDATQDRLIERSNDGWSFQSGVSL